jgi:2-iminobutanoate/2-iminopropanoate deaminase
VKKVIQTENVPKPVGPYSQAIRVDKFLFVSGQVAIDPKEGKIIANHSSMKLFSEFNNEYAKYFHKEFPARATVGIELMPNALVEIAVVAYKE